ncbi:hypothetical protein SPV_2550 [Streptococcus pneumoniae]|nr:hypothetical protein SPV_2550 [Streptococcus pneumoniae]
MLKNIFV